MEDGGNFGAILLSLQTQPDTGLISWKINPEMIRLFEALPGQLLPLAVAMRIDLKRETGALSRREVQ